MCGGIERSSLHNEETSDRLPAIAGELAAVPLARLIHTFDAATATQLGALYLRVSDAHIAKWSHQYRSLCLSEEPMARVVPQYLLTLY